MPLPDSAKHHAITNSEDGEGGDFFRTRQWWFVGERDRGGALGFVAGLGEDLDLWGLRLGGVDEVSADFREMLVRNPELVRAELQINGGGGEFELDHAESVCQLGQVGEVRCGEFYGERLFVECYGDLALELCAVVV